MLSDFNSNLSVFGIPVKHNASHSHAMWPFGCCDSVSGGVVIVWTLVVLGQSTLNALLVAELGWDRPTAVVAGVVDFVILETLLVWTKFGSDPVSQKLSRSWASQSAFGTTPAIVALQAPMYTADHV